MACSPRLEALERRLLAALSAARGFEATQDGLVLRDAAGKPLAAFSAVRLR